MKKAKYSGKEKCYPGQSLVYLPDGSVITAEEIFAGVVSEKGAEMQDGGEVEFYEPNDSLDLKDEDNN